MPPRATTAARLAAVAVHATTAAGALAALGALDAIADGRWRAAFVWLGVALAIDAVDGTLARAADVARVLPQVDGALLDNLVDYATYALVPAWLIWRAGLVPDGAGPFAAGAIAVAAAFQFAHRDAKDTAGTFRGFPSYWNLVALYLMALDLPAGPALAIVVGLAAASFAPLRFLYPTRARRWRRTTLALALPWAALLAAIVARLPEPSPWPATLSLLFPLWTVVAPWLPERGAVRG